MRSDKGFTLMELTIVLAILAIIAAILVPTFLAATDRARLRADVQSARVIQSAMRQYEIERGRSPGTNMAAILASLYGAQMLEAATVAPQTAGAIWYLRSSDNRVMLDLRPTGATGVSDTTRNRAAGLNNEELAFIMR